MSEVFSFISNHWSEAINNEFSGHPIANFLRNDAPIPVAEGLDATQHTCCVKGSAGQGRWAFVPWIAVFDPVVTTSATRGYYVVFLFSADMQKLYLSLNQGTTAVQQEFNANYLDELSRRASLMRARLPEFHSPDDEVLTND